MSESETRSEEIPEDVLSIASTEYSAARLKSGFVNARIHPQDEDFEFVVQVHQDGPDIALSAGTSYLEEEHELYIYQAVTPDQARRVAASLEEAAEKAEDASTGEEVASEDSKSFVRRLLGL